MLHTKAVTVATRAVQMMLSHYLQKPAEQVHHCIAVACNVDLLM